MIQRKSEKPDQTFGKKDLQQIFFQKLNLFTFFRGRGNNMVFSGKGC